MRSAPRPTRSAGRPTPCAFTCSASAAMPRPRRATWRPPSCPSASWTTRPGRTATELGRLDPVRRRRLLEEVNELLFLWVVAVGTDHSDDPEMARRALRFCDRALDLRRAPQSLERPARLVALAARRARAAARATPRCRARDLGAGLLPVGPARQAPARSPRRRSPGWSGPGSFSRTITGISMHWLIISSRPARSKVPCNITRRPSRCAPRPHGPGSTAPTSMPIGGAPGVSPSATWTWR